MKPALEIGSEWRHHKYTKHLRRVVGKWVDKDGRAMVDFWSPGNWEDCMTERGFLRTHTPEKLTTTTPKAESSESP